jgi:hypothetical protein
MNVHTKPSARETLRAAIAVRDEAAARVREAAGTLARAGRLATDAQRRLDVLGDVDGQVLAHATAAYRTFAESGGGRPDVGTPAHLVERQHARNAARQELAAESAAQTQLAEEHAAALREHERRERAVAAAADSVIAEMSLAVYGRYVKAIEEAGAAWDDVEAICGMTVQKGPRWADRERLPGLPDGLIEAVGRGFGHRDEMGQRHVAPRSTAWATVRQRLLANPEADVS